MAVLFANLGIALVMLLAILAPMVLGRWLSDRDREQELAEIAAIEARALAMLAGCSNEGR
jgi:uncharacterized protein YneF (UPF0154 family)